MLWEVSEGKSRFKVDVVGDSVAKVGLGVKDVTQVEHEEGDIPSQARKQ